MHANWSSILTMLLLCLALANAVRTPWGAIYDSARDGRSGGDQTADKGISPSMEADLADRDGEKALQVHVYSFLGHVYLVGAINDKAFRTLPSRPLKERKV